MTPLRNRLQAIGKLHKFQPWHEQLSKLISPNPVVYIFINAEQIGNFMFFETEDMLENAKRFKQDVEKIFPNIDMRCRFKPIGIV